MVSLEQYDYIEFWEEKPFHGLFRSGEQCVTARSFDRGDGAHALRFLPMSTGVWEYALTAEDGTALEQGSFLCTPAAEGNHGPVRAEGTSFRYADGTLFLCFGTTAYAWIQEPEETVRQTLETLKRAPFNKIRMCVFPKHYPPHCLGEPFCFPFEKDGAGNWDVSAPVPAFWDRLDRCILALRDLGIECDLILFHPYDRWGFAELTGDQCDAYLDYCLRRYGAFRNIWWSLANEYDLCFSRTAEDWERFGSFLAENDYADHLRSVHDFMTLYDFTKDWVTHCSIQSREVELTGYWKKKYGKPVAMDEIQYEGDEPGFGDLTAETMTERFWKVALQGGAPTHGETYQRPDDLLWWARGGELCGESPARIGFLRRFLESLPGELEEYDGRLQASTGQDGSPIMKLVMEYFAGMDEETRVRQFAGMAGSRARVDDEVFLEYLGSRRPARLTLALPEGHTYRVEQIDTWNMTRETMLTGASGAVNLTLPGRQYLAVAAFRE